MINLEQDKLVSKILKKGSKTITPITPYELLIKTISETEKNTNEREIYFLILYYGLSVEGVTLEKIGESREQKLTRERVRQIIYNTLSKLKKINPDINNFGLSCFDKALGENKYISFVNLTKNENFKEFAKSGKGLVSFLNDCNVKQVAYRKKIYFYKQEENRNDIIKLIQTENKISRRASTLANMNKKAKTVTYVPKDIKEFLQKESKVKKLNLNCLYENIMEDFISVSPFYEDNYSFTKTKSWKARKGKAEWAQIGIYMDKKVFNNIKNTIKKIEEKNPNISLMGFICQGFMWYKEKMNKDKL